MFVLRVSRSVETGLSRFTDPLHLFATLDRDSNQDKLKNNKHYLLTKKLHGTEWRSNMRKERGSHYVLGVKEMGDARKTFVCPVMNTDIFRVLKNIRFNRQQSHQPLQASHGCDVPNCRWHETDHVKNNCISTVVSYICYTTLLSVNCGYDTCWVSGVVLAAVARREQLGCSAADGTVTFPAGDPEHLNSGWRRKFSFTRESSSRIKEPIGSSHHSWAPMRGKHPRCGFLDKY